jgi:GTP-binding protein Era
MGILNGEDYQMVLVDTPGIHAAKNALHQSMVDSALASCREVDVLVLVSEVINFPAEGLSIILRALRESPKPVILALNKIDLSRPVDLLPLIDKAKDIYPFESVVPVSARRGDGIAILLEEMRKRLGEGPRFFPDDIISDQPESFIVAETIREKIYFAVGEELPYSAAVTVEDIERGKEGGLIKIRGVIHVEREGQKAIVIGKGGKTIKTIGTMARRELESVMGVRIFLDLSVRVEKNWTRDARALRRLGY